MDSEDVDRGILAVAIVGTLLGLSILAAVEILTSVYTV